MYRARHRKYDYYGQITPNVTKQHGELPTISATPAPYLPLKRYNEWDRDYIVVSMGKPIALDSYGYLVPAGLAIDLAAEVDSPGSSTLAYATADEDYGILGPTGVAVTAGDKIAPLLVEAGITISAPFAIANQSFYLANSDELVSLSNKTVGKGGVLPTEYRFHNYNPQSKVSVLCDYVIEVPVVTSYDPLFGDMAVFNSAAGVSPATPGCFVKFDVNSNYVLADATSDTLDNIVGQVIECDKRVSKGFLKYVQTFFGATQGNDGTHTGTFDLDDLNKMPGSATDGEGDITFYAGGSMALGTIQINLIRF